MSRRGWNAGVSETSWLEDAVHHKSLWPVTKKANRGFRGYPVATVAFYGPDDRRASKVAVGILPSEGGSGGKLNRQGLLMRTVNIYGVAAALTVFPSCVRTSAYVGLTPEQDTTLPVGERAAVRFGTLMS